MKNIWPPEDENSGLIGFKQNLKNLCNLIISISESVAINCDKYIKSHYPNDYPSNDYLTKLFRIQLVQKQDYYIISPTTTTTTTTTRRRRRRRRRITTTSQISRLKPCLMIIGVVNI